MSNSKAILIVPDWRQPGYVGNYRIDRFIRWLSERGDELVVVRAGERDALESMPWGTEIVVRDPLGLHRERSVSGPAPARKPNALRRTLAYWAFNPDPTIVWGRRTVRHPLVLKHVEGARWVISTSPPESAHVAASQLADKIKADLIVDMRDGWLDEPLKPILQNSRLRRWLEGRLERRVLGQARRIYANTELWKQMLQERLPFTAAKTTVLTNAYPNFPMPPRPSQRQNCELTILHAGKLTGSNVSRRAPALLDLLLAGLKRYTGPAGTFMFLGNLSAEDNRAFEQAVPRFAEQHWKIKTLLPISHEKMMEQLLLADGLLLYSTSQPGIPCKSFDYILTGKPILSVCPRDSMVWRMATELPQYFTADLQDVLAAEGQVAAFLEACQQGDAPFAIPEIYSEAHLRKVFLEVLPQ